MPDAETDTDDRSTAAAPALVLAPPATRPAPVAGPLDATDLTALSARLGEDVAVHGTVSVVGWTAAHNGVNLEFAGPDGKGLLVWIAPKVLPRFAAVFGPGFPDDLKGRSITLKAPVGLYAGRRPGWQGRMQMTVRMPSQLVPDAGKP